MYQELVTLLRKKYDKAPLVMAAADVIVAQSRLIKMWEEVVKAALNYIPCWVSVSDGLPEDGVDVLCWLCNDAGECYASVGRYNTTFKQWDLDSEYAVSRYVTHWMPLLETPED